MQIACPNCARSYRVADASLGANGRMVRCVHCRNVWLATAAAKASVALAEVRVQAEGEGANAEAAASTPLLDQPPLLDAGARALVMDQPVSSEPVSEMPASIAMAEAPPLVPPDHESQEPPPDDADGSFVSFAARRAKQKALHRVRYPKLPSWPTAILSLLVVIGAILAWRADVVRVLPQTASLFAAIGMPVNLRGLAFADLKTTKETYDGVPVLVVEGVVTNVTKGTLEVPRLRFALLNDAGVEVYTWSAQPPSARLQAGETQPFSTRLASPPADGHKVLVRFFNRRDDASGRR